MSDDNDNGPSWSVMGNSTCLDPHSKDALWPYCPSYGAAVFFTLLFFLASCAHIVLAIKWRKAFCWVLIMGTAWEMIGFALRSASTQFQQSMGLYMFQTLFILLAPLWINAFIYMLFARLVYCFDDRQKAVGIPATKLGVIFVLLDIVAFIVQVSGGSMLSSTDANTFNLGKKVYMAGIGFQESFLLMFTACIIIFHVRNGAAAAAKSPMFRPTLWAIYAALFLITVRIIFRIAEYSQGFDAAVVHTESYQYIFDAVPMLIAPLLFTWWHPGRVLQGPNASFPSRKERKAEKKQAKALKEQEKAMRKAHKKGSDAFMTDGSNSDEENMLPYRVPQYQQTRAPPTVYTGYAESFATAEALESQTMPAQHTQQTTNYERIPVADIGYTAPHPGQPRGYQHY